MTSSNFKVSSPQFVFGMAGINRIAIQTHSCLTKAEANCFVANQPELKSNFMENPSNCIDACLASAMACEKCISECIEARHLDCLKICRDCADVCMLCARLQARGSDFNLHALCEKICSACSRECEKHAAHLLCCRECALACQRCAETCREMAKSGL